MYMLMGGLGLFVLVVLILIIFFFVVFVVLCLKGYVVGVIIFILFILIVIFVFKMLIDMVFVVVGYGFIYGLWLIVWVIVVVVFLYKLIVVSGQFDIICSLVIFIIDDQCLQVLLIGFFFGVLLEGVVGFGVLVVIIGVLLVGLGFKLLYVVGLCLIVNIVLVVFGVLGVLILVVGQVMGIDLFYIGVMVGCQLLFLLVFVLFWLVVMMDGWKGVKEMWLVVLVVGGSFVVIQFFIFNYIGLELLDIILVLVSIVLFVLFFKVWWLKNIEMVISMG